MLWFVLLLASLLQLASLLLLIPLLLVFPAVVGGALDDPYLSCAAVGPAVVDIPEIFVVAKISAFAAVPTLLQDGQ